MEGNHGAGKGDTYRHVDHKQFSDNWDKIFGKKPRKRGNNGKVEGSKGRSDKGDATRSRKRRTSGG